MAQIFNKDFSAGWTPDDDENNGRPNGLLNFQNVNLNENGAIEIERGGVKINLGPFAGSGIFGIYSKYINGVKNRYVGTNSGVITSTGNFTSIRNVIAALSGNDTYAFGNGFGQIFCSSGAKRFKDDGTASFSLGIQAPPLAPVFTINQPPILDVFSPTASWTLLEGSALVNSGGIVSSLDDPATTRTVVQSLTNFNTLILSGGSVGQDTDVFQFEFHPTDTSFLDRVRIEFLLDTPTGGVADVTDYYYFEWPINVGTSYRLGINQWSTLKCLRSDFIRVGTDVTQNWSNVKGINVRTLFTSDGQTAAFSGLTFFGGSAGALTGNGIQYYQQNVRTTGSYQAKSPLSPITAVINILTGSVTLTPNVTFNAAAGVTDIFFYRSGNTLDNVYFVGSVSGTGVTFPTFTDNQPDINILKINIKANLFLNSIFNLGETFLSIEGPIAGRMAYLTDSNIYISDLLNPDAYDTRFILRLSSVVGERNLWIQKVGGTILIVGTTADIYVISGTFSQLSDGTIDVNITSLGVKQPPISRAVAVYNGAAYYVASDGIRYINSGTSFLVSSDNRLLFDGFTRYGVVPIDLAASSIATSSFSSLLCINKNKLYFRYTSVGGSFNMMVYDLVKQYWKFYTAYGSITALFSEEDGILLGGFFDDFLRILNSGNLVDSAGNFPIVSIRTPLFDGGYPRQRKDIFTLTINADTGNTGMTVELLTDLGEAQLIGFLTSNGLNRNVFNLQGNAVDLRRKYALRIIGAVPNFKLVDWSIDFDIRPIPVTSLRIEPTNYGIAGRKRINNIPLVIDTLGGPINVTPLIDGTAGTPVAFTTSEKRLIQYQYDVEKYGTMIGLLLSSNSAAEFEFYELVQPKTWDLLPDTTNYLYIPQNNLGTHQRKRITALAIIINTFGATVTFTVTIDNATVTSFAVVSNAKTTVLLNFTFDVTGVDISGVLDAGSGGSVFEYYGIDIESSVFETLPHRVKFLRTQVTNFGSQSLKRLPYISFDMDTLGASVTVTPFVDGVSLTPKAFVSANGKKTFNYYLLVDQKFTDFWMLLSCATPFEFYDFLPAKEMEIFSDRTEFLSILPTNMGTYQRKRIRAYAFIIDSQSAPFTLVPFIDGVAQPSHTYLTASRLTVIHYFTTDTFGVDIGGTITSLVDGFPFSFYGPSLTECIYEVMPGRAAIMTLSLNNLGSYARKRIITIPLTINTFGNSVTFTPSLDGVPQTPLTFSTPYKQTIIYYFQKDAIGVELGGIIQVVSGETFFEFHELVLSGAIFETLPPRSEYTVIANNNLGTYSRKRMISIPLVINTFGFNVTFTPSVDNVNQPSVVFNTNTKTTVVYFFPDETIGVDFGGFFTGTNPFEYYELILPEAVIEKMPPRSKYYVIPNNNFNIPTKKRVRVIPMVINTFGSNVNFIPSVDGVYQITGSNFNTTIKKTVFHYFANDSFGTDYGGKLLGNNPFEFYGFANDLASSEDAVEVLPVAKIFDQVGPYEFNQSGKVLSFRLRAIATGTLIRYTIFADDIVQFTDNIDTTAFQNQDHMYSVKLPKSIICVIFRMEFLADAAFNKFSCEMKVNIGGVDSRDKYIKL